MQLCLTQLVVLWYEQIGSRLGVSLFCVSDRLIIKFIVCLPDIKSHSAVSGLQ